MAHIHDLIDFTITAYIIHKNKVLLIDHKTLKKWLPVGGHIELDEDPEQALIREIKEESGLDVEVIAQKPELSQPGAKFLFRPEGISVHNINDTHKHVDLIYFCKSKTAKVALAKEEHNNIRWFSEKDFADPEFKLEPSVKYYAKMALERVRE